MATCFAIRRNAGAFCLRGATPGAGIHVLELMNFTLKMMDIILNMMGFPTQFYLEV